MASIFMAESKDVEKNDETADFSWDKYTIGRPIYPPSFWNKLFGYHGQHSGKWDTIVDIGAGAAINSKKLGDKFKTVAVTEPNEEFLQVAKKRLSSEPNGDQKYSFHQAKFDDKVQNDNSIDMVFASECMQWAFNPSNAINEFYRQLKPGGTFAETFYIKPIFVTTETDPSNPQPLDQQTLTGNHRINEIWSRWWDIKIEWLESNGGLSHAGFVVPPILSAFKSHDLTSYTNVERIFINVDPPGAESTQSFFGITPNFTNRWEWTSAVDREREKIIYTKGEEDWYFDCDMQFARDSYETWPWAVKNEEITKLLEEMEGIFNGGTRRAYWFMVLNLASKPA